MPVPTNLTDALALLTFSSGNQVTAQDVRDVVTWLSGSSLLTRVAPSGDATGASDRAAVHAVTSAGRIAVLDSSGSYFDDGQPITFAAGARVITTDERPAFWQKGSSATTHMTALPGCVSSSGATITMRLPPAANWPEQVCSCEATAAITITVDPDGSELIGPASTATVGGPGERLTIGSRGTSPLLPIDTGSSSTRSLYGEGLFGVTDSLFLRPGTLTGGGAGEYGNYELYVGRLRGPGFTSGTAIVGKDAVSSTTLFDWQIFGTGSATGYLYWREAFPYGYRIQLTNASGVGQGYSVTATGAAGAVDNIVVGADGSLVLASVATRSTIVQHGSTNRLRIDANGFIAWSPNTFNSLEVQDAGISLSHAFGYVDITGGGSPGVTLNTTDSTTAISSANSALLRRAINGRVYEREFVITVQTTNATPFEIVYTTTSNTAYGVEMLVTASNDTDDAVGIFAARHHGFKNVAGVLSVVGGGQTTVGTDRLDASINTATVAIASSGVTIRPTLTGISGKTINWNVILRFRERVIA